MTEARHPIFERSSALVDEMAKLRPTAATSWGVAGHDARWDDLSPSGQAEVATVLRRWEREIDGLPPAADAWSRLAMEVVRDWIDLERVSIDEREHERDLNSIASPFQGLRMTFDSMPTEDEAGWENIAARLEGLGACLESYQASLAAGLARGNAVATRQVLACIDQGRVHTGPESYFVGLARQVETQAISDVLKRRVSRGTALAAAAYGRLTDWLARSYLPKATHDDGVGRTRYRASLRRWLGQVVDLEETYAWGFEEVARLSAEMDRVSALIRPGVNRREVMTWLQTAPEKACGKDEFITRMRERQTQALRDLVDVHFEVPLSIRQLDVREAPPGGPLGAYYMPPSEDFKRAGAIYYSLEGDVPVPLYDQVSTAYHEGFPGHHLQCGLQVTLIENLCRLHRVAYGYSGYAEGWALYAERLMGELGYYEAPEFEFGMLQNQLLRACRVILDIGLHVGFDIPETSIFRPGDRWSYDVGVELIRDVGGLTQAHAESEVTRYCGWPGQAISYKVGERVFLDVRTEFLARGGDLRTFHARALGLGNVGLDILRRELLG
jgi:uncharacterized protein (DUF885 family)